MVNEERDYHWAYCAIRLSSRWRQRLHLIAYILPGCYDNVLLKNTVEDVPLF